MVELVVDTAFGMAQVALKKGQEIYVKKTVLDNNQAENIAVLLQEMLLEYRVLFEEVKTVYCLIGPGSFTGIRIGIAFVKGLVVGKGIRVVAIPNFYLFVSHFVEKVKDCDTTHVLIDCGKNKSEFYAMSVARDLTPCFNPQILTYDEVRKMDFADGLVITNYKGDGVISEIKSREVVTAPYDVLDIKSVFLLPKLDVSYELEPLYIRASYV